MNLHVPVNLLTTPNIVYRASSLLMSTFPQGLRVVFKKTNSKYPKHINFS